MKRLALVLALLTFGGLSASGQMTFTEVVTIPTADGLSIAGDLWPAGTNGAPGVVALHMYRSDRTAWEPVASRFAAAGIDFLAIDMRGHGDSAIQGGEDLSDRVADRDRKLFGAMHEDAAAAVRYLVNRGTDPKRIALLGASVGCSVAIDAVRRDPDLLGATVLTPGTSYLGIPTMKHLEEYGARPIRILTSQEEADEGSRRIAKALGDRAELVVLPQKKIHGTRMFGAVLGIEERIADWFTHLLGGGLALDGEPDSAEDEVVRSGRWISARGPEDGFFLGVLPDGEPEKGRGFRVSKDGVTELRYRDGRWVAIRLKRAPGMVAPRTRSGSVTELLAHLPPGMEKVRIVRSEKEDPAAGPLLEEK